MGIGRHEGDLILQGPARDLTRTENAVVVAQNLPLALDLDPVVTSLMIRRKDLKKRKATIIKMKIKKESHDLHREANDWLKKKSNKNE